MLLRPLTWNLILMGTVLGSATAAELSRYYAHDAVEDTEGVIAPWYQGINGQCDFRVRIAAETLKRYPWTDRAKAVAVAPEYVFSGAWAIADDGTITIPPIQDWANGDLGQRAAYVLSALVDYYRYTGDPAAIAHLTILADILLDHCQTPKDHPWPEFLISVPVKGKPYGPCDPHGMIQLDIVAEVGLALARAYQVTGEERWLSATKHWADLLAHNHDPRPGSPPWGRYANPEEAPWGEDQMTGGVAFLLFFFDELIRLGYEGEGGAIVRARDAGRVYLRDALLPRWTVDDTWGRNYWDWPDPVQAENVTEFVVRYLMEHSDYFSDWRTDARNILSLFLNRTSVAPESGGDAYSGAWAYPESSGCCGRSLWYGPMELAPVWAQYGVIADNAWAREMGRRQQILATYDCHETGVVEDNIEGGKIVAGDWFKIAHPMALKHVLASMAWQPEVFGANRENHLMRSSAVVSHIVYGKGRIAYTTFDAPPNTVDILRLSFLPASVSAAGRALAARADLSANGYLATALSSGDYIISIRHDGARNVVIEGDDPQVESSEFTHTGEWKVAGDVYSASAAGVEAAFSFTGNQVRIIGAVDEDGGLADVYLDGEKQRVGIDCWNPRQREQQVLYYRNGLSNTEHTLRIVNRGVGNPLSQGTALHLAAIQYSAATGAAGYGQGTGSTAVQRMLFGYTGRHDYIDTNGNAWRPGTEFVLRSASLTDVVKTSWWMERRRFAIANTPDPELYRYGIHGREFWINVSVGPGEYYVRLKFAETRSVEPALRAVTILINGEEKCKEVDLAATAGGMYTAVDLVFEQIRPKHGAIEIRLMNTHDGEAIIQALEAGPGNAPPSVTPVCLPADLAAGAP